MMRPIAVFVLAALAGCATAGAPPAPAPPPPPEPPPAEAPQAAPEAPAAPDAETAGAGISAAVHWVRDSAEYRAAVIQTYRTAAGELDRIAGVLEPGSWAVALDADDTVISNSRYQKERELAGGGFTAESWAAWVARREATPLPGAVEFLDKVREMGGRIAIVSNRNRDQCPDTEANFRSEGIPYDVMLCRTPGESEKEPRWERIARGTASPGLPPLEIVLWIGDNIRDFPDLDQELRHAPPEAFEEFGVTYFMVPNPMYGSWEDNPAE